LTWRRPRSQQVGSGGARAKNAAGYFWQGFPPPGIPLGKQVAPWPFQDIANIFYFFLYIHIDVYKFPKHTHTPQTPTRTALAHSRSLSTARRAMRVA